MTARANYPAALSDSVSVRTLSALAVFTWRAALLAVFVLLSLMEPVVAAVLGFAALACLLVSLIFGFVLHAPFGHRWFVLGAAVVLMSLYLLFRFVMLGVQKLLA